LKITFLGTGTSQGVPIIACNCSTCSSIDSRDKRLRSSILIERNETIFSIDAGPDFRYQLLRENVKKLDAILLTHEHRDHIAGLDDVRAFNYIQKKPMDVYAEKNVCDSIETIYSYVFAENKYPGIPELNMIHINENKFELNGIEVFPIRGFHQYLPVLGFRIDNFAYITDMNRLEDSELEKLKDLDVLVITALRKKKHVSHYCLQESLEIIEKLKPKMAYLTHISHQLGTYEDVSIELPSGVLLAYDKLIIEL
jgi:phosphoribosyl 1,2-cyclic phosphate phosphodiesterase